MCRCKCKTYYVNVYVKANGKLKHGSSHEKLAYAAECRHNSVNTWLGTLEINPMSDTTVWHAAETHAYDETWGYGSNGAIP